MASPSAWEQRIGRGTGSISLTTVEDLTVGDPVGIATEGDNSEIARAVRAFAYSPSGTEPTNITNADTVILKIIEVAEDSFAILYRWDAGVSDTAQIVIATLDADTKDLTFGTPTSFTGLDSSKQASLDMTKLDTDKLVVCYVDGTSKDGDYHILTISGTVITIASTGTLGGSALDNVTCCQLDTDKFAFMYYGGSSPFIGFATVSGSTPTVVDSTTTSPSPTVFSEAFDSVKIATDKFAVVANHTASSSTVVCTTAANTLTVGTPINIAGSSPPVDGIRNHIGIASAVDDTYWARFNGEFVYFTVSGTVPTAEEVFTNTDDDGGSFFLNGSDVYDFTRTSTASSISKLTWSGTAIVRSTLYGDMAVDITSSAANTKFGAGTNAYLGINKMWNSVATSQFHIQGMSPSFLGFAQATVSKGAVVRVETDEDNNQSSLNPGTMYKVNDAALEVTTDHTEPYKVIAVSDTKVRVI